MEDRLEYIGTDFRGSKIKKRLSTGHQRHREISANISLSISLSFSHYYIITLLHSVINSTLIVNITLIRNCEDKYKGQNYMYIGIAYSIIMKD